MNGTSDRLCEWVFSIIHSIDLFNNIHLFRNETSDYSWVSHLNYSLCWFVQKNWIIQEKKQVIVFEWDIWIINFFYLFNTTDSFRIGQMIAFVMESFESFTQLVQQHWFIQEWNKCQLNHSHWFVQKNWFIQTKQVTVFMSESYESLTHSICSEELNYL